MDKSWLKWGWQFGLVSSLTVAVAPDSALAQLIPNNTLGAESSVINKLNELNERIDGGASRGTNLFHSFLEFNVGEGRGVYFANPAGITNILSRVTGGNASQILGRLGVLGEANLFLLNPNGIIFGPNASLDIKGSFVGSTANGIRLGEDGFFSATEPGKSNLLSVSPGALFFNQATNQAGNIINRGNLAVGKDLTLAAGNLDLQGQLFAGGNLTLQGFNSVKIRDTVTNPFVAAVGGNLLVQGNQSIDIFALNHPASGLVSGRDMVLRSANTVGGDAHFWSGGSFRIEKLDGSLGGLVSTEDPVIRSLGDVKLDAYRGTSLHILAAGKVEILNAVILTGVDPVNGLVETVTLSDGTTVAINGRTEPTLDIRAGVDPSVVRSSFFNPTNYFPFNFTNVIFNPNGGNPPNLSTTPTSADIRIGTIVFARDAFGTPLAGKILLTNQYQPNPTLNGNIQISAILGGFLTGGATRTGDFNNGGSVILDSRGEITVNGLIQASADPISFLPSGTPVYQGNGGDVTLLAKGDINFYPLPGILYPLPGIRSEGVLGGKITLNSQANISVINGSILSFSYTPLTGSKAGDINITAKELSLSGPGLSTSTFGGANAGNFKVTVEKLDIPNIAQISTNTFGQGKAGNIIVIASESIKLIGTSADGNFKSALTTETSGIGKAGDIDITTKNLSIQNGATISTATFGQGNAGDLTVSADSVELIGTSADLRFPTVLRASTAGTGNAGNLTITTRKLTLQNGGVVSTATLGSGRGGNLSVTASDSIEVSGAVPANSILRSGLTSGTGSGGQAGDLTIKTDKLTILGGGIVSSGVGEGQQGKAGNLTVTANSVEVIGTTANGFYGSQIATQTEGKGNAGILNINTEKLILRDGGQVASPSLGEGSGNTLTINASELIEVNGVSTNGRRIKSGIISETSGTGNAGDINIFTRKLSIQNGGIVSSGTFSGGRDAGNIIVNASELVELLGRSADGISPSGIEALTAGSGNAGNLTINTSKLKVQDGAQLITSTVGKGSGGTLTVNASDSVDLIGRSPNGLYSSGLFSSASSAGDAGGLTVTAGKLMVSDGAGVVASTTGQGNAGNILIKAADSILLNSGGVVRTDTFGQGNAGSVTIDAPNAMIALDGFKTFNILSPSGAIVFTTTTPSSIISSVQSVDGLTGDRQAGDITINVRSLSLTNNAILSSSTSGRGNAGNIQINIAENAVFDNLGSIFTIVDAGGVGNAGKVNLTADSISLTRGGGISTYVHQAVLLSDGKVIPAGQGNGGNVSLRTNNITVDGLGLNPFGNLSPSGVFSLIVPGATGTAGNIDIQAANSLTLKNGATINSTLGFNAVGRGGDITVKTASLSLSNGAGLFNSTFGQGNAGNIKLDIMGAATLNNFGTIQSAVNAGGVGNAGTITLNANSLSLTDGASILTIVRQATQLLDGTIISAGQGNGGNIMIKAGDILLDGVGIDQAGNRFSSIVASSIDFGAKGIAGNINIQTDNSLTLSNDAQIRSSLDLNAIGRGGDVTITGRSLSLTNNAQINASTFGQGQGGNITIQTTDNSLTLKDSSQISSRSQGQGNAGNILINSQGNVSLTNSDITTSSEQTSGGAITLTAKNIRLYGDSDIRTNVNSSAGGGGNITLTADSLIAYNDSDILAFARDGRGGNITLNTPIFFGEGFQAAAQGTDPNTLDNNNRVDINASGAVSGVITIPDLSFIRNSLTELPENLVNTDQLIANSCVTPNPKQAGTFIITGPGGLPVRPNDASISAYPIESIESLPNNNASTHRPWQIGDPIIEPQRVYQLSNGQVVLSRECPR